MKTHGTAGDCNNLAPFSEVTVYVEFHPASRWFPDPENFCRILEVDCKREFPIAPLPAEADITR